jgi:hypothetical protein
MNNRAGSFLRAMMGSWSDSARLRVYAQHQPRLRGHEYLLRSEGRAERGLGRDVRATASALFSPQKGLKFIVNAHIKRYENHDIQVYRTCEFSAFICRLFLTL